MQLIEHPRPGTTDYFIALAQEVCNFAEETLGVLLSRDGRFLTLSADRVGRTTYFVLKVEDTTEMRVLAYSYTSSREELGMDVDEFIYDYFSTEEEEDE